jgi:hypothetical protein
MRRAKAHAVVARVLKALAPYAECFIPQKAVGWNARGASFCSNSVVYQSAKVCSFLGNACQDYEEPGVV